MNPFFVSDSTVRRRKREAAKRDWQKAYYADTPAPGMSRQAERAASRRFAKQQRITPAEYGRRKMDAVHKGQGKVKDSLPHDRSQSIWKKEWA